MTVRHTLKQTNGAELDLRIAAQVRRALRKLGFDAHTYDIRDAHGARLVPVNLRCGHCYIAVRRMSARVTERERDVMRNFRPHFIQHGSADIGSLVQWLTAQHRTHWNSAP